MNSPEYLYPRDTTSVETYKCYTLFDITYTGVTQPNYRQQPNFFDSSGKAITDAASWQFARNQQRNWDTLIQVISLRAQPMILTAPSMELVDAAPLNFGEGMLKVWTFDFGVDVHGPFTVGSDSIEGLLQDCTYVPMITSLSESSSFKANCLEPYVIPRNVAFVKQ